MGQTVSSPYARQLNLLTNDTMLYIQAMNQIFQTHTAHIPKALVDIIWSYLFYQATPDAMEDMYLSSMLTPAVFNKATLTQREGVKFLYRNNFCGMLSDDMGVGKSFQQLMVLAICIKRRMYERQHIQHEKNTFKPIPKPFTAFLVCPPGLMMNWDQEARKFIGLKRIVHVNASKDKDWREAGTQLYIASSGSHENYYKQVMEEQFDMGIIDESHVIRSPNAKITQHLVEMMRPMPHRILISGSPAVIIIHLFCQLNLIAPNLFNNYHAFGKRYCVSSSRGSGPANYKTAACSNPEELRVRLSKVLIRRYRNQGDGNSPGMMRFVLSIALPAEQRESMTRLENKYKDAMELAKKETEKLKAKNNEENRPNIEQEELVLIHNAVYPELDNIFVPMHTARQLGAVSYKKQKTEGKASSTWARSEEVTHKKTTLEKAKMLQDSTQVKMVSACSKLKATMVPMIMDSILSAYDKNTKFVHFTHHTIIQDNLRLYMINNKREFIEVTGATAKKDRQKRVNTFQSDAKCTDAILSIVASGRGFTLTASHVAIMWELRWNPDELLQAECRVNRLTQTKVVTCYYVVLKALIEDIQMKHLVEKSRTMSSVLDFVLFQENSSNETIDSIPDSAFDKLIPVSMAKRIMKKQAKKVFMSFEPACIREARKST